MAQIEQLYTFPTQQYVYEIIKKLLIKYGVSESVKLNIIDDGLCGPPYVHKDGDYWVLELGVIYINQINAQSFFYANLCNRSKNINEIFEGAIASIFLHEIGHILNNSQTPLEREQEKLANEFEFNEIINSSAIFNILGSFVAMLCELEMDILFGRNPCKEYENHPATLVKMDSFLSKIPKNTIEKEISSMMQLAIKVRPLLRNLIIKHNLQNIINLLQTNTKTDYIENELYKLDDE